MPPNNFIQKIYFKTEVMSSDPLQQSRPSLF